MTPPPRPKGPQTLTLERYTHIQSPQIPSNIEKNNFFRG
jgi:hypothetical protein